jgi:dihydrofolate reductase
MDVNRGIGKDNGLPWHISSDLRQFKKLTMGHHIIMGRKTYESISKPLLGRVMVILTRSLDYQIEGCVVLHSIEDAIRFARRQGESELFIIGGGDIFDQTIEIADRIYLTKVDASVKADTFFPQINADDWKVVISEYIDNSDIDQYPYTFQILERIRKSDDRKYI